jgi:2-polyprenyl-6-hydroxyphenyl methylase/3-demethylubiquinone-9 3-methyltransferase
LSLTDRESHFEFGENWRDYAKSIDQKRIDAAILGVRKLFPDGLAGKTFLDIGCGSGLHSLAALSLGAASVTATDIDENSVSTTRDLLTKYAPDAKWTASVASVFDLSPAKTGMFDVVYSWGVLHHTGDMWRAIEHAAALVKPGGLYAIAIYTKTPRCGFWKKEKKFYKSSPKFVQAILRLIYMSAFLGFLPVTGWDPIGFVRNYKRDRGMNWSHDVHDWLGGYPYESASSQEVHSKLSGLGLSKVRSFEIDPEHGLWGAGCSEYVSARPPVANRTR